MPAATVPFRIHVIEDDPTSARVLSVMVRNIVPAEVTVFEDGLGGLAACLRDLPDLVITDLELPGLRGEEICRLLRSSPGHRHMPILVCSGMDDAQRKEMELLRIGADRYISKPVPFELLRDTLNALLTGASPTPSPSPQVARPSAPPTPAQAVAGEALFAGYDIQELVGGGGMGTVYRAVQRSLGRAVALKVLLRAGAGESQQVLRFRREARVMAALAHPNIVRIFQVGETEHTFYIVMEYVDGPSLARVLDAGPLQPVQAAALIPQMFEAVVYLHSREVLHRDIKPGNFLLSPEGLVKLTDFGISRADRLAPDIQITRAGLVVGTPAFMAPEQLMGAPATQLTDQYSLARTVLCLFEGGQPSVPPRPLREIRPDLPSRLSDALARCMDLYPEKRFASVREAAEAVQAALDGIA